MELIKANKLAIGHLFTLKKDLNFTINLNDIVYITGNNGSGKSTLINTLMKEIRPKNGSVSWSNKNLSIGYLPQLNNSFLPLSITLEEVLISYGLNHIVDIVWDQSLNKKKWNESSGGEKQRTLIMSQLACYKDVLFLDEPFNHIDQQGVAEISHFLNLILKKKKVGAIVLISHILPVFSPNYSIKKVEL